MNATNRAWSGRPSAAPIITTLPNVPAEVVACATGRPKSGSDALRLVALVRALRSESPKRLDISVGF
jgi:hypothetical protein